MFFLTPDPNLISTRTHRERLHPRQAERAWVSLPEQNLNTYSQDLSVSGCRLEADLLKNKGERIPLALNFLNGAPPLPLQGEVVWSNNGHSGLRFVNTPLPYERRLASHLGEEIVEPTAHSPLDEGTYRWFPAGQNKLLRLDLANWIFTYTLADCAIEGARKGTFASLRNLESPSGEKRTRFLLLDQNDEVVLEVDGREIGFQNKSRRREG